MSEPLPVMLSVGTWGELMLLYSGRIKKGVFQIRSAKAVATGTKVKVTLVMPDRQEVQLIGSVTTCPAEGDGFQVKLTLDPLAPLDRERLENVTSGKPGSRTPVSGVPMVVTPRQGPRTPAQGTPVVSPRPTPVPAAKPTPVPATKPASFVRPATPVPAARAPGDSLLDIFDEPGAPRTAAPTAATIRPGSAPKGKRESLAGIFDTVTPAAMPTPLLPGDAQLQGTLKRADDAVAAKNWATAAAAFEGALRLLPGDPGIEARFGIMRAREALAGDDEETARIFVTGALERDPSVLPDDDELRGLLVDKKPPPPSPGKPSGLFGRLLGRK